MKFHPMKKSKVKREIEMALREAYEHIGGPTTTADKFRALFRKRIDRLYEKKNN